MKKIVWMLAAILFSGLMLTACNTSSGTDETTPDEFQAKIANTRWELAEILNQNNEWVAPSFYAGVDIRELSFALDNKYFMRICKSADRQDVTLINGKYDIERDVINMTDDCYQGIAYALKVTTLNGNTLEGQFTDWGIEGQTYAADGTINSSYDVRHYTVRLKRTDK